MRAATHCKKEKKTRIITKATKRSKQNRKEKSEETSKRVKGAFRSCFVFVLLPRFWVSFWFAPLTSRERNKPPPPSMSFIVISFVSQLNREGQFKVHNGWRVKSTKKRVRVGRCFLIGTAQHFLSPSVQLSAILYLIRRDKQIDSCLWEQHTSLSLLPSQK